MTLQVANLKHKPLLRGSMPYFSVILKRPEKPAALTLVYAPPRLKLRCSSGTMFQSACPKSPIMSTQTYPASAFPCGDTESWQLQSATCVRLGKPVPRTMGGHVNFLLRCFLVQGRQHQQGEGNLIAGLPTYADIAAALVLSTTAG